MGLSAVLLLMLIRCVLCRFCRSTLGLRSEREYWTTTICVICLLFIYDMLDIFFNFIILSLVVNTITVGFITVVFSVFSYIALTKVDRDKYTVIV